MTREDAYKLGMVTYSAVKSQLGLLGDLPYELANSVANIYWRYFEGAMDSAPPMSMEEMDIRTSQFNAISGVISEFRRLQGKGVTKNDRDAIAFYFVNMCKYRITGADKKTPIRCMIERRFRKSYDIPDLVKTLLLYQ